MIFITNTIYAKVWKVTRPVDEQGNPRKYIDLQISTSEKMQDGTYEYSTFFPRVIGHAFNSLKDVKEGDKIVITKSKFTNPPKQMPDGSKKSFLSFIVIEAKPDDGSQETSQPEPVEAPAPQPKDDDNCPW